MLFVPVIVTALNEPNQTELDTIRHTGMDEKIGFRCGDGHEWITSPANLVYKNVSNGDTRTDRLRPRLRLLGARRVFWPC